MAQPNYRALQHPVHFFSLGFGSGLLPYAPGTWGTIATLPIYFTLLHVSHITFLLLWFFLTIASVMAAHYSAYIWQTHDHSSIVCDEIVGFLLVLAFIPRVPVYVVCAFVFFRFFDIVKPWPIAWLDKHIKGGLGIVIDDLVAALYTICVMLAIMVLAR